MKFFYPFHIEDLLVERKISKQLVELTVKEPDKIIDSFLERKVVQKLWETHLLRVVFQQKGETFIIITAYYCDKERYK